MILDALSGTRVLALTSNIPGPLAARALADLGAEVMKIEPLAGDALELVAPDWYESLNRGIEVRRLDLKIPEAAQELERELVDADVFLTTVRQQALARLKLDRPALEARFPRLCQVLISGYAPPEHDRPGHDLNYQAEAGLVTPPSLPRALLGDFGGAQRAVSATLALLLRRHSSGRGGHAFVSLADAAMAFSRPLAEGLVGDDGILGGATPFYRCYRTADERWIACGLLEARFIERFATVSELTNLDEEALADFFGEQTAEHWLAWAAKHDLPISLVKG